MHAREQSLLAERARQRALVLFAGAGVSLDAGLPDWQALIQPLRDRLGVTVAADALDEAQWYADRFGRDALIGQVRADLLGSVQPGRMHRALADLAPSVAFTTNYDDLLERALAEASGVPPDVIVEDGQIALIDEGYHSTVVKLHGSLSIPSTIVLTRDDYEAYGERHRAMITYLHSLLATRTFLFVGFSLTDPNFRAIHQAIRRALGEYRRDDFLLDASEWSDYAIRYWEQRGIHILRFPSYVDQEAFIQRVSALSRRGTRAVDAAARLRQWPGSAGGAGLVAEALDALRLACLRLAGGARSAGPLSDEERARIEIPPSGDADLRGSTLLADRARALLYLAEGVDRLTPLDDDGLWLMLGDVLYSQRDAASAIRAYQLVLRPLDTHRTLDLSTLRHVWGNLARAHAYEGSFPRAEWLLRKCVFRPDASGDHLPRDAAAVFGRLDIPHLSARPTDASELAHALSRQAERLRSADRFEEALEMVIEARDVLEPVIGVSPDPAHRLNLFDREPVGLAELGTLPKAYALNFLGKCYGVASELCLDLRHDEEALEHLDAAERHLGDASKLAPLLPYPYAHRLSLACDERLPSDARAKVLASVLADLRGLEALPGGRAVAHELEGRFSIRRGRADGPQNGQP